jgi:hypothetical protein
MGKVVWYGFSMCAESRLEGSWSVKECWRTPDRSLTNTAPIGYLSTPSSVMPAKRAPGGAFGPKESGAHTYFRWEWVLRRDPEACKPGYRRKGVCRPMG